MDIFKLNNPRFFETTACAVNSSYEPEREFASPDDNLRLIAFYLPQFHPFPENDLWWGKGFTEWHNVVQGMPLFDGHIQPRIPEKLGFYDLRLPDVLREQAEMARRHGIYGFCFYRYWFNSHSLMETPLENLMEDDSIDLPFCLCWANENWTRRWDGGNDDLLIMQRYSPEDDIDFIKSIKKYFMDRRYIRVNGKPLLLVYRASELPDSMATTNRWRQWCRDNGVGEIHLVMVHSFSETAGPAAYGFDAAVEFPPHMYDWGLLRTQKKTIPDFTGSLYSYRLLAKYFMDKPEPPFPLYRSIMGAWDNTPRRRKDATVFTDFTLDLFREWLIKSISSVKNAFPPNERFIFINAWNEWGEGSYLEPDLNFGYALLNTISSCLNREK